VIRSGARLTSRLTESPLGAVGAACAITLLLMGPHVLPISGVVEPGSDYGLMAWNLWFVNHALTHGKSPLETDLVYYPLGAHLAKHTLVAGLWPVTFAAQLLSGDDPLYPVYACRASTLLLYALAAGLTFVLLRRLGLGPGASVAPAVGFAFSAFNRLHVPHLNHLAASALLPLVGLALVHVWERPTRGRAALLGLVLGAGFYFTELIAFVWLALVVGAAVVGLQRTSRAAATERLRTLGWPGVAAFAAGALLAAGPFLGAWLADEGKSPKARQVAHWSANPGGLVVPHPEQTPLYSPLTGRLAAAVKKGIGGREVFLGYPALLFGCAALTRRHGGLLRVVAIVTAAFLVLSLGPVLKVWGTNTGVPLPYALLMKVPPFDVGRTPVRCVLIALFGLAILSGFGLQWAVERARSRGGTWAGAAVAIAVALWATAEGYAPTPKVPPYSVPRRLSELVPGPVVNVPLSAYDGFAVFMQVFHRQPIVTGFVSRRSPAQVAQVKALDDALALSAEAFVAGVKALGCANVILGPGTPRGVAEALLTQPIRVVDLRDAYFDAFASAPELRPRSEP
jgi:hypothetical protein